MTDKKISQLPAAAPLTGAELVPIVQAGVTAQTTIDEIAARASTAGAFSLTNLFAEIAGDTTAQAQAQANLGIGAVDFTAGYTLAKS